MPGPGRKPTVSDVEILAEMLRIHRRKDEPFVHPTELTDALDMGRQGVYKRLTNLEDQGYVHSKKSGGARNFWVTEKGESHYWDNSGTQSEA